MKSFNRREQEVWEACDLLLAEHANAEDPLSKITGQQIIEKLVELGYKRGNNNQLYQYRNTWLVHRNISYQSFSNESSILNDRILSAVKAVHSAMNEETEDQINRMREQCRREVEDISASRKTMEQSYDSLKHEYLRLENQFNELNEKYADLERSYQSVNGCYATLSTDHKSLEREYETYKSETKQKFDEFQAIYNDTKLQHKDEVDRIIHQNKLKSDLQERAYEAQKTELRQSLSQYEAKSEQLIQEKSTVNNLREKLKEITNLNIQYEEMISINTEENNLLKKELKENQQFQQDKITLLERELQVREARLSENDKLINLMKHSNQVFEAQTIELLKQLKKLQAQNDDLVLQLKQAYSVNKKKKAVAVV